MATELRPQQIFSVCGELYTTGSNTMTVLNTTDYVAMGGFCTAGKSENVTSQIGAAPVEVTGVTEAVELGFEGNAKFTTLLSHGLAVGDWVQIYDNSTYGRLIEVVAVPLATTFIIDFPYFDNNPAWVKKTDSFRILTPGKYAFSCVSLVAAATASVQLEMNIVVNNVVQTAVYSELTLSDTDDHQFVGTGFIESTANQYVTVGFRNSLNLNNFNIKESNFNLRII